MGLLFPGVPPDTCSHTWKLTPAGDTFDDRGATGLAQVTTRRQHIFGPQVPGRKYGLHPCSQAVHTYQTPILGLTARRRVEKPQSLCGSGLPSCTQENPLLSFNIWTRPWAVANIPGVRTLRGLCTWGGPRNLAQGGMDLCPSCYCFPQTSKNPQGDKVEIP